MSFVIALISLLSFTSYAQVQDVVNGSYTPGIYSQKNYVKNYSCLANTKDISATTGATVTKVPGSPTACRIYTNTAGAKIKFALKSFDDLLKGNRCEVIIPHKEDGTAFRAYIERPSGNTGSLTLKDATTSSKETRFSFDCGQTLESSYLVIESIQPLKNVDVSQLFVGKYQKENSSSFDNAIENGRFEEGLNGWKLFNDGPVLVDGDGGIPTISMIASGNFPLQGDTSLLISKPSGSVLGQGVAYDFELEKYQRNSRVEISLNHELGELYKSGDIGVYIYDIDSEMILDTFNKDIQKREDGHHVSHFFSSSSKNYRLIILFQTSSADVFNLKLDNVSVFVDKFLVRFSSIENSIKFKSYGPIQFNTGSKGSTPIDDLSCGTKGTTVYCRFRFKQATAGNQGSGVYIFTLPPIFEFANPNCTAISPPATNVRELSRSVGRGDSYVGTSYGVGLGLYAYCVNSKQFSVAITTGTASIDSWGAAFKGLNYAPIDISIDLEFEGKGLRSTVEAMIGNGGDGEIIGAAIVESNIYYDRDEFHTDERNIGKSFNGKPVFRKCVSNGSYANNTLLVDTPVRILRQFGQAKYGAEFSSVPVTDGAGLRRFMVDTNNRIFWRTTQTDWVEACVEYVKL